MRRFWPALDLPVLVAILMCGMMGYASRYNLNPDGVSYLDLAAILRDGDISHFVQEYWSPLYPILLAVVQTLGRMSDASFLPWVHGVDTVLVVLTILAINLAARRTNNLVFGLSGTAVVLLAAGRLPRVETVTPDVLLAFILTLIACELLTRGTSRWRWLGVLFGLAFLAKTSSWPWMLVALAISLVGTRGAEGRRHVLRIGAVAFAVMLCWIVPISITANSPTLGSAGRLNYCWYIKYCDSRMPETHSGSHERYVDMPLADSTVARVARFDGAPWTYQPWGNPTEWDGGIRGGYTYSSSKPFILSMWVDLEPLLRIWTLSVTVTILLPLFLAMRRRGMLRELGGEARSSLLLMLIGFIGITQFVIVHAEPRLIAPFVLVGGLGVVAWLSRIGHGIAAPAITTRRVLFAVGFGWVWSALLGWQYIGREFAYTDGDRGRIETNRTMLRDRLRFTGSHARIVLIGPAGLLMSDAWLVGGRIVAQVTRPGLKTMNTWSAAQREELVMQLMQFQPDVIWVTLPDGSLEMIPVR